MSKPNSEPHRNPRGPIRRAVSVTLDPQRIRRAAVAIWMNILIGAVVVAAAATTGSLVPLAPLSPTRRVSQRALTLFAIWLLSFVPGWLYVRFLCLRKEALWNEYVMNLYRLGVDDAEYLPRPRPSRCTRASPVLLGAVRSAPTSTGRSSMLSTVEDLGRRP